MIKLGDKNVEPEQILKVTKGKDVVWEKEVIKTLSWNLTGVLSPYNERLLLPGDIADELINREILEVKIGGFKPIDSGKIKPMYTRSIIFTNDFSVLLEIDDWISKGTKITVNYK